MDTFDKIIKISGNTIDSVVENVRGVSYSLGKQALHSMAPDEYEYYMCSLELLDSSGSTKGFLSFVVMPNNIMESETQIASITKTNSGISTLFNSTFIPKDISIQGTFGRKFRYLVGVKQPDDVSKIPFFGNNLSRNNTLIKTGYGLTRLLKMMITKSRELDDKNNPCILLFNNYAFNTHYVVEVMQSSFSQNIENNMLWYYNLEMKAVAPASAVKRQNKDSDKSYLSYVASNSISKGLTNILNKIPRII